MIGYIGGPIYISKTKKLVLKLSNIDYADYVYIVANLMVPEQIDKLNLKISGLLDDDLKALVQSFGITIKYVLEESSMTDSRKRKRKQTI
jgi:hypothetical protein